MAQESKLPSANLQRTASMSKQCVRCGKVLGFFGRLTANTTTGYCRECQQLVKANLDLFRQHFLHAVGDNHLSHDEWQSLMHFCQSLGINHAEACGYVRVEAVDFITRLVGFYEIRGTIDEQEAQGIWGLESLLMLGYEDVQQINDTIEHLGYITSIRSGHLPTIKSTIVLQAGEIAHYEGEGLYDKTFGDTTVVRTIQLNGRIVVTSKRMLFLAPKGGFEIPLGKIARIETITYEDKVIGFILELSRKSGNGAYIPSNLKRDPDIVVAVLETLVKTVNRQLVLPSSGPSRHVPQDVKLAVWQRDQGQCVQCGSNQYLEYDHIIPHSKGGASTINNVQLLCRGCNNEKRDRI